MIQPAETFGAQPSDGQLLAAFVQRREQAAFTQIVRRHGDMVWAVCMSVLGNGTDAQDAAQAVFLTLARRATSLRGHPTLAGWLHRVAWYVATRAAAAAAMRRQHEREAARMNRKPRMLDQGGDLPADRLHEGLSKLPEKYRLPLILHHLEGRSQEEVAVLLGQKTGTVVARLTRGRAMLRKRMLKGGLAVSAVALATTLSAQASASAPASLATGTTTTASAQTLAWSKGALHMLYVAKMKLVAFGVTAALVLSGGVIGGVVAAEKIGQGQTTQPSTLTSANRTVIAANGPQPAASTQRDKVAVEHLALEMLTAIRDKDDAKLQALAVGSQRWRDALPYFALDMRERFTQMTGKPFVMVVGESLVRGDRAVVKCTGPKELGGIYLVLFFVKTDDGWRNWSLRNSPPSRTLADHMAQSATQPATQPATKNPDPPADQKTEPRR